MRVIEERPAQEAQFVIALTAAEVELLYDALDARNDRFENWMRGIGTDGKPTALEKERFKAVLVANSALTEAFQPLIRKVRQERR